MLIIFYKVARTLPNVSLFHKESSYLKTVVQTPVALSVGAVGELPSGDFHDVARGVPDHGGASNQHKQNVRDGGQQNGQQGALGNIGRGILTQLMK